MSIVDNSYMTLPRVITRCREEKVPHAKTFVSLKVVRLSDKLYIFLNGLTNCIGKNKKG